ncbi:hypothetical protein Tco_0622729 [Tanacetum coccineum]
MVDGDKPKDSEGTENYKVWAAAVQLALHTRNKLGCISQELYKGQIFSKNPKIFWDELEETYNKEDGSVIFKFHYKIHSFTQSGSYLSEYYHNLNALWRQFDSLVNLPNCTCNGLATLKKHNQLLRLMQFLIGLDNVFAPIRSQILTTKPLPDVKSAFSTLSRDESHRINNIHTNNNKGGPSALPNEWTANKYNNQNKKFNRANLVCKHCNRNGHTIVRCFELVVYPQNFKKKDNQSVSSNAAVAGSKVDQKPGPFVTHSFTNDRFQKLVALISDKSGSGCVHANIAVGHPNGTKALVTYIGSFKLSENMILTDVLVVPDYHSENKDYEMVSQDTNSLNFFNNFDEETRSDEPYDDNKRDRKSRQGEDTNPSSFGGTENTGSTKKDEGGHPSTPEEAINEEVDGVTHEDDNMSEGDDFYDDFNEMFQQSVEHIDNHVSYSKLSLENFIFSTSINKIREPKTHDEASSDIKWIEAMNLEMEALNRNGTWLITLKEESQFMDAPTQSHLKLAFRVLRLGKSLLAKSFAEAEYRAINSVTCEVIWVMEILAELNTKINLPVSIHCDNSSAIQIAANPIFHERSKHFEIELLSLRRNVKKNKRSFVEKYDWCNHTLNWRYESVLKFHSSFPEASTSILDISRVAKIQPFEYS